MGNRFVTHKTRRIEISDGDWIQVKEVLNIGEALDVEGAGMEMVQRPGENEVTYSMSNPGYAAVVRVAVWLTGWSFCDAKGKQVAVSRAAVGRLDADTFSEIREALNKHIKDMARLRGDPDDDVDEDSTDFVDDGDQQDQDVAEGLKSGSGISKN